MTIFTSSIRARMTLFIVAFLAIVIGLAVSGELVLKSVGMKSEEIDQKWLAGMAILAEMGDRVAEYRIAEGVRVLASDPKARAEAALLADEHRRVIQDLQNAYITLLDKDARIARRQVNAVGRSNREEFHHLPTHPRIRSYRVSK